MDPDKRLLKAAADGDSVAVLGSLASGVSINFVDDFGQTALICACVAGHLEIVRLLLAKGANVGHRCHLGLTALHQAVSWERVEIVQALLDAGAEVEGTIENGTTPLMIAAMRGNADIVRLLLARGADPARRNSDEWNSWCWATDKGNDEIAELLVQSGAQPIFPDAGRPEEKRLDIHPGSGIGPIRRGMRPAEVQAVFREPQVYEEWMGGNLNDALLFHGLTLHFNECDSRAPLPNSTLVSVVIHQREDAYLFGRRVSEWTKDAVIPAARYRGYDVQTLPNGDVEIPGYLGMSFDDEGRLIWVEV